jgi:dsDNA-binding SOS-regulon protein
MSIFEKKTVYIYEINGKEKAKTNNAEEAIRWDNIFKIAEDVDWILQNNDLPFRIDEPERTELALFISEHKNEFLDALKGNVQKGNNTSSKKTDQQANKPTTDTRGSASSIVKTPTPPSYTIPPSKDGFSL